MRLRRNALLGLASPFDVAQDDRLCYSVEIVLTKSEHLLLNSCIDKTSYLIYINYILSHVFEVIYEAVA